jgi:predicted house-cleaning noncanonical NTP pyrophosphatase (MazG superfamily)
MKKLIRDKIPEIMIQQGKNPKIETLTDDAEYENALCEKLIEEVDLRLTY